MRVGFGREWLSSQSLLWTTGSWPHWGGQLARETDLLGRMDLRTVRLPPEAPSLPKDG